MKVIPSRNFAILIIILLSFSSLTIFNVKAHSIMTIKIDTDGSIDPTNSSIKQVGNTYTFTRNIRGSIEVLIQDITIDGDGYTLDGDGSSTGINIQHTHNVTIKNLTITNHLIGIKLSAWRIVPNYEPPTSVCLRTSIANNTLLNNDIGVLGDSDMDTVFSGNYLQDNRIGVDFRDSNRVVCLDNQFWNNRESFLVDLATYYDDSNIIDGIPVSTPTPAPTPTPTLTPTPTSSPELEPLPTTLILTSVAILAIVVFGFFSYFKKRRS